jgi:DNA-directed RNA polymerase specialized sigma24 family protein
MNDQPATSELIKRINLGDRDALGEFVLRYAPLIRRRVGGKLGARMRRVMDSADIVSTVLRRLDLYASGYSIRAHSEAELWTLIMRVVDAAVLQKVRLLSRLKRADVDDVPLADLMHTVLSREASPEVSDGVSLLERAFAVLEQADDQKILWFWLSGMELRMIACVTGRSPESTRKRWESIRKRLRASLEEGGTEGEQARSQHA